MLHHVGATLAELDYEHGVEVRGITFLHHYGSQSDYDKQHDKVFVIIQNY